MFDHANQPLYLQRSWTQTLCEASGFFKCTKQAGPAQRSLMFSQAQATGTVWSAKPAPSNKAASMAETQGSTLPRAENHHLLYQREFLHPAVPRDMAAEDYMPSSAQLLPTGVILSSLSQPTGEAKTREALARLEGEHAKLTLEATHSSNT